MMCKCKQNDSNPKKKVNKFIWKIKIFLMAGWLNMVRYGRHCRFILFGSAESTCGAKNFILLLLLFSFHWNSLGFFFFFFILQLFCLFEFFLFLFITFHWNRNSKRTKSENEAEAEAKQAKVVIDSIEQRAMDKRVRQRLKD